MNLVLKKHIFFVALCLIFIGCRDPLSLLPHCNTSAEEGKVPVQLVLKGLSSSSRTIAPDHISMQDLVDSSKYIVILDGASNMGDTITLNPANFSYGVIGFDLNPGTWTLQLTATDVTTSKQVLRGSSMVVVQSKPVSTTVTLTPLIGETGTVNVTFTLSDSIMHRLDKDTAGNATIIVALYDTLTQEVAGTNQVFTQASTGNDVTLSYNANSTQLDAGRYTIKLESSYSINNGSTGNQSVRYEMGYEDILYVEGNRETHGWIALSSNSKELGVPENPARKDKMNSNGSSNTANFTTSTPFNPWGECVWLNAANWDGVPNDSDGNEVLIISWGEVYNADYYEVEILIYPFTVQNSTTPTSTGKFSKVVTSDAEWNALKNQSFQHGGQSKTPSFLQFSGDDSSLNYYKNKTYDIGSTNSGGTVGKSLACADYNLFKSLEHTTFATGGYQNATSPFPIGSNNAIYETYGTYSYNGIPVGKIGLEAGCSVLPVLTPGFAPRMSVQFRVRGVNQYGHSDWVYWKGGRW